MTPQEFESARDRLGLSNNEFAAILHVKEQRLRWWLDGRQPIPQGVADDVNDLEADLADLVDFYRVLFTKFPDLKEAPAALFRQELRKAQEQ